MKEGESRTPEPLNDNEAENFRKRVADMGLIEGERSNATLRELELADMVMRLTNGDRTDPSQLVLQAEIISGLLTQRDILLRRFQEQRQKYEADLEGFHRSVEALISTGGKKGSDQGPDEDLKRKCVAYEKDNKHLLEKLAESQSRFNYLESELNSLRPYLLLQPGPSTPSVLPQSEPSSSTLSSQAYQYYSSTARHGLHSDSSQKSEGKRKALVSSALEDTDHSDNDESRFEYRSMPNLGDYSGISSSSNYYRQTSQSTPNMHTRKTTAAHQASPIHSRKGFVPCSTAIPLLGDARAEHLLLAVRKIGRERVEKCLAQRSSQKTSASNSTSSTSVSTSNQNSTSQLPKPTASSPRTPRRAGTHLGIGASASASIIRSSARSKQPHSSSQPSSRTPLARTYSKSKGRTQEDPPTPMDSLVSAARSMMEGSETSRPHVPTPSAVGSKSRRKQMPESTISPKRRKIGLKGESGVVTADVSGRNSTEGGGGSEPGKSRSQMGRTKSALDVLADQAAVFSSQESLASRTKGKDRDKGQENESITSGPPLKTTSDLGLGGEEAKSPMPSNLHRRTGSVRWKEAVTTSSPDIPSNPQTLELLDTPPSTPTPLFGREMPMHSTPSSPTPLPSSDYISIPILGLDDGLDDERLEIGEQDVFVDDALGSNVDSSSSVVLGTGFVPTKSLPAKKKDPALEPVDVFNSEISFSDNAGITMEVNITEPNLAVTKGCAATPKCALMSDDVLSNLTQTPQSNSFPSTPHPGLDSSPVGGSLGSISPSTPKSGSKNASSAQMRPGELLRVVGGQEMQMVMPGKRPRSPYVKWSQEEDDLLAQAVAKYGQKWDLVQKALPSRGYHQVRQRWLRKLGVFDPKPDVTTVPTDSNAAGSPSSRTGGSAASFNSSAQLDKGENLSGFGIAGAVLGNGVSMTPRPKLGLAPLSSELALSGTRGAGR